MAELGVPGRRSDYYINSNSDGRARYSRSAFKLIYKFEHRWPSSVFQLGVQITIYIRIPMAELGVPGRRSDYYRIRTPMAELGVPGRRSDNYRIRIPMDELDIPGRRSNCYINSNTDGRARCTRSAFRLLYKFEFRWPSSIFQVGVQIAI